MQGKAVQEVRHGPARIQLLGRVDVRLPFVEPPPAVAGSAASGQALVLEARVREANRLVQGMLRLHVLPGTQENHSRSSPLLGRDETGGLGLRQGDNRSL